jgi:hypothetical protein
MLHGLVLKQAAFHTQIHYDLCHRLPKITLRSYKEYIGPSMVPGVDIFYDN